MANEKSSDLKKMIYIGAAIVGVTVIAVYAMTSRTAAPVTEQSKVTTRGISGDRPSDTLDPEYRKLTALYNQQQSDQALNSGKSFVGMDLNNEKIVTEEPGTQSYGWEGTGQKPAANQANQGTNSAESELEKRKIERLNELITKIEAARTPSKEIKTAKALFTANDKGENKQNQWASSLFSENTANGQNKSGSTEAPAVTLIKALTAYPAVVDSAVNSDSRSMKLLAHIASGQYQGARLFSADMAMQGDGIEVKFTSMEWKGDFYTIEAYAVDAETKEFAIASEVNNRWFSRILLPALANGIGQTGQLYKDSNSQMIITSGGNEYRSTGNPSGKAVAGTIVGGIGEQAGKVMAEDASKLPVKQVTVNKGKVIGVQFIKPVTDADKVRK